MHRLLTIFLIILFPLFTLQAQDRPVEEELVQLLNDFLYGASVNDAETHDRFWADDLIYTSSAGERYGKDQIMRSMENTERLESPAMLYTAEEIQINVYGDTAIVAFQLVGTAPNEVLRFLNSGTFLKRDGKWQVVNWQATRMAE